MTRLTARGRTITAAVIAAAAFGSGLAFAGATADSGPSLQADAETFTDAVNTARWETVRSLLRPACQDQSNVMAASALLSVAHMHVDSVTQHRDGTGTVVLTTTGGVWGSGVVDTQAWVLEAGRWSPEEC